MHEAVLHEVPDLLCIYSNIRLDILSVTCVVFELHAHQAGRDICVKPAGGIHVTIIEKGLNEKDLLLLSEFACPDTTVDCSLELVKVLVLEQEGAGAKPVERGPCQDVVFRDYAYSLSGESYNASLLRGAYFVEKGIIGI